MGKANFRRKCSVVFLQEEEGESEDVGAAWGRNHFQQATVVVTANPPERKKIEAREWPPMLPPKSGPSAHAVSWDVMYPVKAALRFFGNSRAVRAIIEGSSGP